LFDDGTGGGPDDVPKISSIDGSDPRCAERIGQAAARQAIAGEAVPQQRDGGLETVPGCQRRQIDAAHPDHCVGLIRVAQDRFRRNNPLQSVSHAASPLFRAY